MTGVKKVLFFLIVLSVPLFLFVNARQSFKYERLSTEVERYELEQKEWLEENKRMLSTYSVFSSPARVQKITEDKSELSTSAPGQSIIVNIKNDAEGSVE